MDFKPQSAPRKANQFAPQKSLRQHRIPLKNVRDCDGAHAGLGPEFRLPASTLRTSGLCADEFADAGDDGVRATHEFGEDVLAKFVEPLFELDEQSSRGLPAC